MNKLAPYAKFLKASGLTKYTIKNYLWHTAKFLPGLGADNISTTRLRDYRLKLLKSKYSPATINLHLTSINKYLGYLGQPVRLDLTTNERKELNNLTARQLDRFFEALPSTTRLIDLRDRALVELLYDTSLKVGQIIYLKRSQLDTIKQEIILNQQNHISIRPSAGASLQRYLDRRIDDIDYLFINLDRTGKGSAMNLSIRSIERIIDKYGKKAGLKVNPQILRNTLARQLKKQGAEDR